MSGRLHFKFKNSLHPQAKEVCLIQLQLYFMTGVPVDLKNGANAYLLSNSSSKLSAKSEPANSKPFEPDDKLTVKKRFPRFFLWNHETAPTKSDPIIRCMEWLDLGKNVSFCNFTMREVQIAQDELWVLPIAILHDQFAYWNKEGCTSLEKICVASKCVEFLAFLCKCWQRSKQGRSTISATCTILAYSKPSNTEPKRKHAFT